MAPISSIQLFPISTFQYQSGTVKRVFASAQQGAPADFKLTLSGLLDTLLIHQLPRGPAHDIALIFKRIHTYAAQAAEIDQTYKDKELLQSDVKEDLSNLKTILSELAQDELTLFAALFQHVLQNGIVSSTNDSNDPATDVFIDGFKTDSLGNFFRIDVISERGTLAALDLTGTVIDILTRGDDHLDIFQLENHQAFI